VPFLTMIGLRVTPGSAAAAGLRTQLGVGLPTRCGGVEAVTGAVTGAGTTVLWLAPEEFLLVSGEPGADLTARLVTALRGEPGSAVDLSANRTTFELTGPSALDVLQKGCPLDLHPRSFAVGSAYLTTVGPVAVVLWKAGEQTYRLLPRSSFADFLGRWLVDAMLEYRHPEPPGWR
jgi:sarcosine oxidase subunit gamma